jgi:hypothetical protein
MVIKTTKTEIYLQPEAFEKLKDLLYAIPNVEIFVPTQNQYTNKDKEEIIKITQFYKMMQGVKSVGVLLGKKDEGKIRKIEKWPLI